MRHTETSALGTRVCQKAWALRQLSEKYPEKDHTKEASQLFDAFQQLQHALIEAQHESTFRQKQCEILHCSVDAAQDAVVEMMKIHSTQHNLRDYLNAQVKASSASGSETLPGYDGKTRHANRVNALADAEKELGKKSRELQACKEAAKLLKDKYERVKEGAAECHEHAEGLYDEYLELAEDTKTLRL